MFLWDHENGADVDCSIDAEALVSDVDVTVAAGADGNENEGRDFDSKE